MIWLQGGPGGSSMFGLFAEMGPYSLEPVGPDKKMTTVLRNSSWNKNYGMLFIDNPVGAGFSFTENDGYCKDTKECVAKNLFSVIEQFYLQFPDQKKVELWVTGESYGGHYVPGFAYYIHNQNQGKAKADKVPLAGIAVGDGWIDPVNMVPGYPDMIYNQGLISELEKAKIQDYCDRTVTNIKAGKMLEAFDVWDQVSVALQCSYAVSHRRVAWTPAVPQRRRVAVRELLPQRHRPQRLRQVRVLWVVVLHSVQCTGAAAAGVVTVSPPPPLSHSPRN